MAVPKAHINDLISLANNAKGSSAQLTDKPNSGVVTDFINMLAKYAAPVASAVGDVGNGLIEPGKSFATTLPHVIQGDKNYQPPDPSPSAQRGLDTLSSMAMTGQPAEGAVAGNMEYIAKQGASKAESAAGKVATGIEDIASTARAQPGGLQAGFIKVPGQGETPNLTKAGVLDAKGNPIEGNPSPQSSGNMVDSRGNPIVISPNPTVMGSYKRLSPQSIIPNTDPRPRMDAPSSPEYSNAGVNPPSAGVSTKEPIAPVTKPVIAPQPALTAAQQKAFAKSGLDKYQLPAKYGDKRAPFEAIDKSVMANVIGGNSPEEILQNIPKAEQKVWGEVTKKAATISAVDVDQGVIAHIENNLQDLVKQGIITDTEAAQRLAAEKTNIFSRTADPLNPTSISGKNLVELQTGANAAAPKKIPQGMTRPEPYMNKAIAQGYRDAIGDMSPDIRYSYNQYSSIKRIGEMSSDFRNESGAPPTIFDQFKKNPIVGSAVALGAVGSGIAGVNAALPTIESVGGSTLGLAGAGINGLQNTLGYVPKTEASNPNENKQVTHSPIIPQDAQGRYILPQNPNVTPLTPGTPEYIRANNALSGSSRQFMANSPQYMSTANNVNDDIKSGMPLNLMTKFKSAQDVQAYLSDSSNPYAKQLANIADLDAKFKSAYTLINGTAPGQDQFINPGDSQAQFQQKYDQIIKFIYDNYSQYQVPYLQTTSAPMTPNNKTSGTVPYQQPQQNDDWSGMKQGAIPSAQGLPPIGAIPAQ